jgi:N-acetylmuramoyl-L-alanine amidase
LSGFDVHFYNLAGQIEQTIPAQPLRGYTQAGDVVISPDGQQLLVGYQERDQMFYTREDLWVARLKDVESDPRYIGKVVCLDPGHGGSDRGAIRAAR